nr:unnamed protein product [Spirometra erinaceieuropaei]
MIPWGMFSPYPSRIADEGVCDIRKKVYQFEQNYTVLSFLAQRTIQFLQIDDEVFYVDSPNCWNLHTNESMGCSSEIQGGFEKMKVELPHLHRFKELKAFWRAGDSLEGITFQTHSKPRYSRENSTGHHCNWRLIRRNLFCQCPNQPSQCLQVKLKIYLLYSA